MSRIQQWFSVNFYNFSLPDFRQMEIIDLVQIILIAILVYHLMLWIKNTRAYTLLKGILVVAACLLFAKAFQMNAILWIWENISLVAITGVIVIFQPELRRALEQLGEKKIISSIISFNSGKDDGERFNDNTINELVRAVFEMGEVKTGALIVIEQNITLSEYEKTGIMMDSMISSQLLLNIFEHNTPLHDGAVIVRGNRIMAATCYLPLSDNRALSKNLGTRHRAGVGISEVSDSITIIVSEETGNVSYALGGNLRVGITPTELREQLHKMQKRENVEAPKLKWWKRREKNEKISNK